MSTHPEFRTVQPTPLEGSAHHKLYGTGVVYNPLLRFPRRRSRPLPRRHSLRLLSSTSSYVLYIYFRGLKHHKDRGGSHDNLHGMSVCRLWIRWV